jgi:hypothetical protein
MLKVRENTHCPAVPARLFFERGMSWQIMSDNTTSFERPRGIDFCVGGPDCRTGLNLLDLSGDLTIKISPFAQSEDLIESLLPDQPVPRSPARWHQEHEALVQKAKTTNASLVFFGDSITKGMSQGNALQNAFGNKAENFGIVGDSTQHLLWRLQNGETSFKTEPKEAVLLIGANNIGAAGKEAIVRGIVANVKELTERLPDARLLVLGILPQGKAATDPRRAEIKDINAELARQLQGKSSVSYFDAGPLMLEKDGSMSSKIWWNDGLHPRDYTPMFDALKPILEKMDR